MEQVEIKGLKEMLVALRRTVPANMQGRVLQKALTPATRLVVVQARALAPVRTGRMRRAIYATRDRFNSTPTLEQRVVTVRRGKKEAKKGRDAYYWKFVEFGHRIATKKTGYLYKEQGRSMIQRFLGKGSVGAGFVPAHPFMRPAFESTKQAAAEKIVAGIKLQLEEAARKARW